MSPTVIVRTYRAPAVRMHEILRYAGGGGEEIRRVVEECLKELEGKLSYSVCFCELTLKIEDNECHIGDMVLKSSHLAKNLKNAERVILFGATVGAEIDRLIARYSRLSPSRALMLQAIGAERIEALCDLFCEDVARELSVELLTRFSAGYGDLDISAQKDIFAILDCPRKIGLTLTDSLLMMPSKSVTAFIGIRKK